MHLLLILGKPWISSTNMNEAFIRQKSSVQIQSNFVKKVTVSIPAKNSLQEKIIESTRYSQMITEEKTQNIKQQMATILETYLDQVRIMIEENKTYPASAKKLGIDGEIVLRFRINRLGHMNSLEFIQKANFEPLNEAAKNAITRVRNFPAIPSEIQNHELVIDQKINFKLK